MMDYETSTDVGELAKALVSAQLSMRPAVKDSRNPHLKNKYADLGSVRDAVMPVFLAYGIAVTQGAAIGQSGYVAVVTQFTHTSGQWMRSRVEVPYQEQKGTNIAQAYGSALSYARRYALASMACVVAEDDDGNGAAPPQVNDTISDIRSAQTLAELRGIAARIGKAPPADVLAAYNARKDELAA